MGKLLSSINWERVLNKEDSECRYKVFCRLYQYWEDFWISDKGPPHFFLDVTMIGVIDVRK